MIFNFILPFFPIFPGGGAKIMYEYANRLAEKGHTVRIYHSLNTPYFNYPTNRPFWLRKLISIFKHKNKAKCTWFNFNEKVQLKFADHINDRFIEDADATVSTWWALVEPVSKLRKSTGKKVNLVQGYEIWEGNEDLVHKSYQNNDVKYVCITDYLVEKVLSYNPNADIHLIFNGIDQNVFFLKKNIENRNPLSVCMLFSSNNTVKGSLFGIEALKALKNNFPELEVNIFGVEERSAEIPLWMNYFRRPDHLNDIYNSNAIFLSPSITEGWALPPAEAMMCGCLFVGTDINGHEAYLFSEHSVKIKPANIESIINVLTVIFNNNELRIKKAEMGCNFIKKFNWETAIENFLKVLSSNNSKV